MNRETIIAALFDRLTGLPGLVTISRRLKHWADVPAAEQPALFLTCGNSAPEQTRGLPPKWRLQATLHLYVNTGGDDRLSPSAQLNELLDAIEAALAPTGGEPAQTLGGLVSHAWISGAIETDEGVLGDQGVAILPLEILVP